MAMVMLDNPAGMEALSQESAFLYQPHKGALHIDASKPIDGGSLHVAHYHTSLAVHTSGIYEPDGFEAGKTPAVAMHGALMTGVLGHNQKVATEMMQDGALVVMMGQPRYHYPKAFGLSLIEDANEMMGFLNELEDDGRFGPLERLWLYGESQGAMKAIVHLALAGLVRPAGC